MAAIPSGKIMMKNTAAKHIPTESIRHFLWGDSVTLETRRQWEAPPELCHSRDFLVFVAIEDGQFHSLRFSLSHTAICLYK